jgi:predicted AlkP superfamily pyrophosphatase or phosphodiesterase
MAGMRSRARRAWLLVVVAFALEACAAPRPLAQAPAPVAAQGSGGINRPEHRGKPHIVLISLDGFRADYLDTRDVPNIRRIMRRGARAKALIPVFPSLTFPNHYSLVTGLYPEHHGIVGNSFYDPARRQTYALGDRKTVTDGTWYRSEPIWVTAETQGMVAACFFWPGSEAAIKGVRPTESRIYDAKIPTADRVKTVLDWLRLPDERRPHLITLYFSDVDSASHGGTLDSPRVAEALRTVDGAMGLLADGIDALSIRDRVYLIITSDHGMVETTAKQGIRLDTLVDDMDQIEHAFGGPVASIHVKANHGATRSNTDRTALAKELRDQINGRLQRGRAYLRRDIPERHHYRADPRVGDVVVIMDEAWSIVVAPRVVETVKELVLRDRRGAHGWDPAFPSMHAIFVAMGPGIRAGATINPVDNVDVYPFMTELLGLRAPAGIDGKKGLKEQLMR